MLSKRFLLDLAERAVTTYVEAFVALWIVAGTDWLSLSAARAAAVAAVPAGLSVLKSAFASVIGDKGTAAALPKSGPVS